MALAGPSGSGKSTLLSIAGALERPTEGQVLFGGENLAAYSDIALARVRRRIGFIFQDFCLIQTLSVWENITYPLIPRGWKYLARRERAEALLAQLGLSHKFEQMTGELSSGEQQRIAVARSLAGEPEIILADEPTSNLDAAAGAALIALFDSFKAQGTTILLSSHDSAVISQADTCYRLENGRIVSATTRLPHAPTRRANELS